MKSADEKTFEAMRILSRQGLAFEPASAVAFACMQQAAHEAKPGETWVIIGSGAAVKWPGTITNGFLMPRCWNPDFSIIDEIYI